MSTLVTGKKNGVCLGYSNDSGVKYYAKEFDMADPKDLQEAADVIHKVRSLAAVQRHKELDGPLRQAEEWARKEYRKVREENGGRDAVKPGSEQPE